MRIGELAERAGTTSRSVRHYEQAGLIASERAANGYRVYDERALVRVRNIRHLLAAGLTLDDARHFQVCLDGDMRSAPPSREGLRIAQERLAVLEARIVAQTEARDRLRDTLNAVAGEAAHPEGDAGADPPIPVPHTRAVPADPTRSDLLTAWS